MAHTQAINEATPAGSDTISGGDNQIRELKRDIRERMELDHDWSGDLTHAGKHKRIRLRPANDICPIKTDQANTLTGATASGVIELEQTWNTTGVCKAIWVSITNTASAANSLLMQLVVGAVMKFAVDIAGAIYERGRATALGEWINVAYNAGDYTASTGTWTVEAGDVVATYTLIGKTMIIHFEINNTVASLATVGLRFKIPGGFLANKVVRNPIEVVDAGTASISGFAFTQVGLNYIEFRRTAGNWTAGTVGVLGQIAFPLQ